MKFVISIFCAINRITIDEAYYFKISRVLDFVLLKGASTNFVLAPFSTVNNVMLRELNFGNMSSARKNINSLIAATY